MRTLVIAIIGMMSIASEAAESRRITIRSTPKAAAIFVNGDDSGKVTPASLDLNTGDRISLRRPLYHHHEIVLRAATDRINEKLKEKTRIRMLVELKTANRKDAGTNNLTLAVWLNGNPNLRGHLSSKRDDFRVGGIDKYQFDLDCPPSQLRGVRLIAESGDDLWKPDYLAVRFMMPDEKLITPPYVFPVGRNLSGDLKEGRLGFDFPFRPKPKFYPMPQ